MPNRVAATAMATEAEINECYRRLLVLAESEDEAEYARTLARLDELEEREAGRLAAVFRARQRMDPAAAEAALRRADEILAAAREQGVG